MMIDETPALSKRYNELLEREHQAALDHVERQAQLTNEMASALLRGGEVRHLNAYGEPTTTDAEDCLADADPAELLAILRETMAAISVPVSIRNRIGALFSKLASEFGQYAAENAQ